MLFVVDATVGITDDDEAVVKILRKSGKPVVLAANKVDDQRTEAEATGCGTWGWASPTRSPRCTAAGRATCSTPCSPRCPSRRRAGRGGRRAAPDRDRRQAERRQVLAAQPAGRPSGWSSTTSPGTTVDPVDELVELGGRTWRFIDTAGIRKRVKEASGHEYYASLRTTTAIDRAEVAVLVLDASQSISEQDQRIIRPSARPAGRW